MDKEMHHNSARDMHSMKAKRGGPNKEIHVAASHAHQDAYEAHRDGHPSAGDLSKKANKLSKKAMSMSEEVTVSILTGENPFAEYKRKIDEKKGPCWTGHKKVKGKADFSPDSCVKEDDENFDEYWESLSEDGQIDYVENMVEMDGCLIDEESLQEKGADSKGHKRSTESGAGLTQKGVDAYNKKTGGDLKTAVTTPPSKLGKDSKAAGRRKSFCARSRSWNGERGKAARARWNC